MRKLLSVLIAVVFFAVSFTAMAANDDMAPTKPAAMNDAGNMDKMDDHSQMDEDAMKDKKVKKAKKSKKDKKAKKSKKDKKDKKSKKAKKQKQPEEDEMYDHSDSSAM